MLLVLNNKGGTYVELRLSIQIRVRGVAKNLEFFYLHMQFNVVNSKCNYFLGLNNTGFGAYL
jgi:predicted cation transporter